MHPFPIVNMQGSLSNPNIAIEAAKEGRIDQLSAAIGIRVDGRAIRDAQDSGIAAVCINLGHVVGPGEPFAMSVNDIGACDAFIAGLPDAFKKINALADIRSCHETGSIGVIYGFQNTEMLGGDCSRIEYFANLGVRVMQLTYNGANRIGHGCMIQDSLGLTPFGREAVQRMNECGVLIDLSHSNSQTLVDAIEASSTPIVVSHTGCRQIADVPRNITDQALRRLAKSGGVMGIYAMPFLRLGSQPHLEDFVRHVEHAIHVCGEDHVGIGTDGFISQVDDVKSYMGYLAEDIASRRKDGVSATGESEAVALFLPDMRGPSQFQILADALSHRGHSSLRIEKVLGANFMRVMTHAWIGEK